MRFVVAAWLAGALAASSHSPATTALSGQWEIVADPFTAHGLAGLPDSICGSTCTIRDTGAAVSIDRVSMFDLRLPDFLVPERSRSNGSVAAWQITRTAETVTITGANRDAGATGGDARTRYVLSRRGEFLQVAITRLAEGEVSSPTFSLVYRRAYSHAEPPALSRHARLGAISR